jgi:predicted esterase
MRRRSFLAGAAAFPLAACSPPVLTLPAGSGVRLEHVKSWSALHGQALLALSGTKGVTVRHSVDAWRMTYPSKDSAGRTIQLSGLLALPRGVAPRSLVSWQHGTSTSRADVPSNLSVDGLAAAIIFAGTGRAAVAPDYLGLGVSPLVHTYMVADDTARAVTDMLAAVSALPGVPSTPPFLAGFSQGGHATMAALRNLEAAGQKVLGSAAIAGPHNLRTITCPNALAGGAPSHSLYLSYLVRGYAARYGRPMDSVLTPQFAALAAQLYDQPHEPEAIVAALPKTPRTMFQPSFLDAVDHSGPNWLLQAMSDNEVSHFTPKAPVRLYYGRSDLDVPPREAVQTAAEMRRRGADVTAYDVGPYDHFASLRWATPQALAWLDKLGG